jgi:hypothetical protein
VRRHLQLSTKFTHYAHDLVLVKRLSFLLGRQIELDRVLHVGHKGIVALWSEQDLIFIKNFVKSWIIRINQFELPQLNLIDYTIFFAADLIMRLIAGVVEHFLPLAYIVYKLDLVFIGLLDQDDRILLQWIKGTPPAHDRHLAVVALRNSQRLLCWGLLGHQHRWRGAGVVDHRRVNARPPDRLDESRFRYSIRRRVVLVWLGPFSRRRASKLTTEVALEQKLRWVVLSGLHGRRALEISSEERAYQQKHDRGENSIHW